jgi:hypothetical protein
LLNELVKSVVSTGSRFGCWTVIEETEPKRHTKRIHRMVFCRCDCGLERTLQLQNLVQGRSKQCRSCAAKNRTYEHKIVGDGVNRLQAYKGYERGAKKRGLSFEITLERFSYLASQNCHYCGALPSNSFELKFAVGERAGLPRADSPFIYNGVDRLQNAEGYVEGNCVPCCYECNKAKWDRDENDFLLWIERVHNHRIAK